MNSSTLGHIQEFNLENEMLSSYLEYLSNCSSWSEVSQMKKCMATFLAILGNKTFATTKSLGSLIDMSKRVYIQ